MPEDLHDICQLSARYALALDRGDDVAWRELFTPDFVMRGTSAGDRTLADIANLPSVQLARYHKTLHLVGLPRVTCHGDEGEGVVACAAHHYGPVTHVGGRLPIDIVHILDILYDDRYRRVDGVWRFSERRLTLLSRRIQQCLTPVDAGPASGAGPPDPA